jgi:sporulation protein YlmC with PRC-barrel domain
MELDVQQLAKIAAILMMGTIAGFPVSAAEQTPANGSLPEAQDQPAPDTTQEGTPIQTQPVEGEPDPLHQAEGQADQCRGNLAAFVQQLDEEGFWITGWGNTPGYGFGGMEPGIMDPATMEMGGETPVPVDGTPANQPAANPDGYGAMFGVQSPRGQIQYLYGAAMVFVHQNNQDGCDYVLGQLSATYERYRGELEAAGIDPIQISDWRQEQVALAEPIAQSEAARRLSSENLIGTDVRSRADENLGTVNNVLLDQSTGDISYVVVARGGFLGFGEELVAVPWELFASTPGVNALVLDVTSEQLDTAPSVDRNVWSDDEAYGQLTQSAEEFWQQGQNTP